MEYTTKPCPFCNSTCNILRKLEDGKPFWFVKCDKCGIQTPHFHEECPTESSWVNVSHAMDTAIRMAVDAWNKRPAPNFTDSANHFKSLSEMGIIKCTIKND